jgi:hypothetical protein
MIPRIPATQSNCLPAPIQRSAHALATARAVLASPANVVPLPVVAAAMAMLREQKKQSHGA